MESKKDFLFDLLFYWKLKAEKTLEEAERTLQEMDHQFCFWMISVLTVFASFA